MDHKINLTHRNETLVQLTPDSNYKLVIQMADRSLCTIEPDPSSAGNCKLRPVQTTPVPLVSRTSAV